MERCFVKVDHENSVTIFIENNRQSERQIPFGDVQPPPPDDYNNEITEGEDQCTRTMCLVAGLGVDGGDVYAIECAVTRLSP